MRIVIALILFFSFFNYSAQKRADYEKVMEKFMKFYNNNQSDSICDLFADSWGKTKKTLWTQEDIKEVKTEYGLMKSFKYMDVEPGGALLFKSVFEKSTHATGMVLNKKNKLLTFRFHTTSDYIDKLLLKD